MLAKDDTHWRGVHCAPETMLCVSLLSVPGTHCIQHPIMPERNAKSPFLLSRIMISYPAALIENLIF